MQHVSRLTLTLLLAASLGGAAWAKDAEYKRSDANFYWKGDVLKVNPNAVILAKGTYTEKDGDYFTPAPKGEPKEVYVQVINDWVEPITPPDMPPSLGVAPEAMQIREVLGDVTVALPASPTVFSPATNGMDIPNGAVLKTGANGSAAVLMGGVNSIRLIPNSQASVTQAVTPDFRNTMVDLTSGAVFSKVGKRIGEKQDYQVKTPNGVAAARGTDFVTVAMPTRTDVWIAQGTVQLDQPDGKLVGSATSEGTGGLKIVRFPVMANMTEAMNASSQTMTMAMDFIPTVNLKLKALKDKLAGGATLTPNEKEYLKRIREIPCLIKLSLVVPPPPAPLPPIDVNVRTDGKVDFQGATLTLVELKAKLAEIGKATPHQPIVVKPATQAEGKTVTKIKTYCENSELKQVSVDNSLVDKAAADKKAADKAAADKAAADKKAAMEKAAADKKAADEKAAADKAAAAKAAIEKKAADKAADDKAAADKKAALAKAAEDKKAAAKVAADKAAADKAAADKLAADKKTEADKIAAEKKAAAAKALEDKKAAAKAAADKAAADKAAADKVAADKKAEADKIAADKKAAAKAAADKLAADKAAADKAAADKKAADKAAAAKVLADKKAAEEKAMADKKAAAKAAADKLAAEAKLPPIELGVHADGKVDFQGATLTQAELKPKLEEIAKNTPGQPVLIVKKEKLPTGNTTKILSFVRSAKLENVTVSKAVPPAAPKPAPAPAPAPAPTPAAPTTPPANQLPPAMELPLNIEVLPNGKVKFDNVTYTLNELKPKAHEVAKSLSDQPVVIKASGEVSKSKVKKVVAVFEEAKFKSVTVAKEDSIKPKLMATHPATLAPMPPPSSDETDADKKKHLAPSTAPSAPAAPFATGPGETVP